MTCSSVYVFLSGKACAFSWKLKDSSVINQFFSPMGFEVMCLLYKYAILLPFKHVSNPLGSKIAVSIKNNNMRLLYFCVPMLMLLPCFMASLAMATVKNITTDESALLTFKAHVVDPRSVLMDNWSIIYPICSWVGISCASRHHRVRILNLSSMSLGGTVSPHLGNLSFLKYLIIEDNNFHGHLPSELGQLRRLRFISFYKNKISGSFPSWIGILSKLHTLFLRDNYFTGPVNNCLFNLSELVELDLRVNIFYGNIPSKIGNLSRLRLLNLGDNYFQGTFCPVLSNHICILHVSGILYIQRQWLMQKISSY